jgi:hypothetical protein
MSSPVCALKNKGRRHLEMFGSKGRYTNTPIGNEIQYGQRNRSNKAAWSACFQAVCAIEHNLGARNLNGNFFAILERFSCRKSFVMNTYAIF